MKDVKKPAEAAQDSAATQAEQGKPATTLVSTDNSKNAYLQARRQQRANAKGDK